MRKNVLLAITQKALVIHPFYQNQENSIIFINNLITTSRKTAQMIANSLPEMQGTGVLFSGASCVLQAQFAWQLKSPKSIAHAVT